MERIVDLNLSDAELECILWSYRLCSKFEYGIELAAEDEKFFPVEYTIPMLSRMINYLAESEQLGELNRYRALYVRIANEEPTISKSKQAESKPRLVARKDVARTQPIENPQPDFNGDVDYASAVNEMMKEAV
jgi:hypothetical protein